MIRPEILVYEGLIFDGPTALNSSRESEGGGGSGPCVEAFFTLYPAVR